VPPADAWTPLAELQAAHLLSPDKLADSRKAVETVRGRVAGEREMVNPPPRDLPLHGGFVDLPQKLLDAFRRQGDASDLGKVTKAAARLRENCDRVIVLGTGGSSLGAKALFGALCHTHHNELPAKQRLGTPRVYFAGDDLDNDALSELLELLEVTCVEREVRGERWGLVPVSKSGATLETAVAFRALRAEAARYYGPKSPDLKKVIVPVTGPAGRLREYAKADGLADEALTVPDDVGGRFSVFTPAGLLPAAVLGLDVRALLLGRRP
jgi:glucose-6-phosphate isomerase